MPSFILSSTIIRKPQNKAGFIGNLYTVRALIIATVMILILCLQPNTSINAAPPYAQQALITAVKQAAISRNNNLSASDIIVMESNIRYFNGWASGTVATESNQTNEAGPEGFLFLARQSTNGWQIAFHHDLLFKQWLSQTPDAVFDTNAKSALGMMVGLSPQGDGSSQLGLPFPVGQTWCFMGGAHRSTNSSPTIWAALDFSCGSTNVAAANGGWATSPCPSFVLIVHSNGWDTGYYHLGNIYVGSGKQVNRWDVIGQYNGSDHCTKPNAPFFGPHVHFTLRDGSNQPQSIMGRDIGGWTVQNSTTEYQSCMTRIRDNFTICPNKNGSVPITNEGVIGSGPLSGNITIPSNNTNVSDVVHIEGTVTSSQPVSYAQFSAAWPGKPAFVIRDLPVNPPSYMVDVNLCDLGVAKGTAITLGFDVITGGVVHLGLGGVHVVTKTTDCPPNSPTGGVTTPNNNTNVGNVLHIDAAVNAPLEVTYAQYTMGWLGQTWIAVSRFDKPTGYAADVNLCGYHIPKGTRIDFGMDVISGSVVHNAFGGVRTVTKTTDCPGPTKETIGIYRNGTFYLRNANTTGNADIAVPYTAGSQPYPIVGDWTGAGFDSIGVYDRNTGNFYLRNTLTPGVPDESFTLGTANDIPLAGHWTAAATHDGTGVFRPTNGIIYLRNTLTTGFADFSMILGIPGDRPIAGDWDGDNIDSIGVFRPSTITFYLSNKVTNGVVYGDYTLQLGNGGDQPIAGDWIGQGHAGVGVFRPTNGNIYLKNALTPGFADANLIYGIAGDVAVSGHWVSGSASLSPDLIIAPPISAIPLTATPEPKSPIPETPLPNFDG